MEIKIQISIYQREKEREKEGYSKMKNKTRKVEGKKEPLIDKKEERKILRREILSGQT